MARSRRRMPPHQLGRVDRTNLVLQNEWVDGSERIFEVPLVFDPFRIEIDGTKVLDISAQASHISV